MALVRATHYWRKELREQASHVVPAVMQPPQCDAQGTLNMLSKKPQPSLSWFDRIVAFVTTPFKRIGISGWKETGCTGNGEGVPVRAAQHSTDAFWTVDVKLNRLAIGPTIAPPDRYLRLEVEPGTAAHAKCEKAAPGPADRVHFGGALVIDTDGPFLEIHPEDNFEVSSVPSGT